jgi:O-methyltransferase
VQNSIRTVIGRTLGAIGLRPLARRLEGAVRSERFQAATPATPVAIEKVLRLVLEAGLDQRGDYYEFGIYRGYTFWFAQKTMADLGNRQMRFIGLDSFEGLPEVRGVDRYKGDFSAHQYSASFDYVRTMLDTHGVDWDRTILVPGYYDRTLTASLKREHDLRPAAVAVIDCDLYESARQVLDFLSDDMLLDGSILVFDDWNAFDGDDERGERLALREFLQANTEWRAEELFAYGSYGQVFRLRVAAT